MLSIIHEQHFKNDVRGQVMASQFICAALRAPVRYCAIMLLCSYYQFEPTALLIVQELSRDIFALHVGEGKFEGEYD